MCQPLLQQQFNAWQERHWGCSHRACIYYTLYLISMDDGMGMIGKRWVGDGVGWWWGGLVIWDVVGGMGWVVDGGGVVFCLLYMFYSWILPLTPPLNLMWKILKLPDSWSSRSAGCRSRHFYSALQVQPLQRSYSAAWTLLQHPGISTFTALRARLDTFTASRD